MGAFNASVPHVLDELGRRISLNSGEAKEMSFLYQRIDQHFHAVLLHDDLLTPRLSLSINALINAFLRRKNLIIGADYCNDLEGRFR